MLEILISSSVLILVLLPILNAAASVMASTIDTYAGAGKKSISPRGRPA